MFYLSLTVKSTVNEGFVEGEPLHQVRLVNKRKNIYMAGKTIRKVFFYGSRFLFDPMLFI